MLAEALEAEVHEYLEGARGDDDGCALVVRNGYARERQPVCGAGSVKAKAPRINDRRLDEAGNRRRFKSVILPSYMRRPLKVTEVLPLLYLHGFSSGDFVPVLEEFFGSKAGLSAATITRLTEQWQEEREQFMKRDLSEREYVYVWVDGVHTGVLPGFRGPLVLPGHGRRWSLRNERARRAPRWLPGIYRVVGRVAAGSQQARDASSGTRSGRWSFGLLGCGKGRLPPDLMAKGLGSQNLKCAGPESGDLPARARERHPCRGE